MEHTKILKRWRNGLEFAKDLLLTLLGAILLMHFIVSRSEVPTGSMIPTVNIGDNLIVSPITYYLNEPKKGDIIIFYEDGQRLIKRVIGLPGDLIELKDGDVYINGAYIDESAYVRNEHRTFAFTWSDMVFPYTVPEDSYFVMGDNREESGDSRVFGAVHKNRIHALGAYKLWPFDQRGVLK